MIDKNKFPGRPTKTKKLRLFFIAVYLAELSVCGGQERKKKSFVSVHYLEVNV
jgi:hypothetical protein